MSLLLWLVAPAWAAEFVSGGVPIHYLDEGGGEPILLIHGFTSSLEKNWRAPGTIAFLRQSGYRVIAFDNRGHGQSGKPEKVEDYGVQMVEDAVRLLDHLKIQRAHVVGYSMGGLITMKLIALHPDRILSAVVGGFGWLQTGSRMTDFLARSAGQGRGKPLTACRQSWPALALTRDELMSITPPFLVIVGEDDRIVRRAYVDPLLKACPMTPLLYIPGANHLSCIMKPEFRTGIVNWIQAPGAAPAPLPKAIPASRRSARRNR